MGVRGGERGGEGSVRGWNRRGGQCVRRQVVGGWGEGRGEEGWGGQCPGAGRVAGR